MNDCKQCGVKKLAEDLGTRYVNNTALYSVVLGEVLGRNVNVDKDMTDEIMLEACKKLWMFKYECVAYKVLFWCVTIGWIVQSVLEKMG